MYKIFFRRDHVIKPASFTLCVHSTYRTNFLKIPRYIK